MDWYIISVHHLLENINQGVLPIRRESFLQSANFSSALHSKEKLPPSFSNRQQQPRGLGTHFHSLISCRLWRRSPRVTNSGASAESSRYAHALHVAHLILFRGHLAAPHAGLKFLELRKPRPGLQERAIWIRDTKLFAIWLAYCA